MYFPLYFQKVMLLWQGSIVKIEYGFFRVFGPHFIGKSLSTFKILTFGLWSCIPHPYLRCRSSRGAVTEYLMGASSDSLIDETSSVQQISAGRQVSIYIEKYIEIYLAGIEY